MIDALLLSVRDAVRGAGFGYDVKSCELSSDGEFGPGQPPPRMGDWFASIHQLDSNSDMLNALNEYFGFALTLTRRVSGVPIDRLGDQLLVQQTVRTLAKETGFNAKAEQLRSFLHMNWEVLGNANRILLALEPGAYQVYGFSEPAHFVGMPIPHLVGGEWFTADPNEGAVGLVSELRFEGARRLQAIATYI